MCSLKKIIYSVFIFILLISTIHNICFADDLIEEIEESDILETGTDTSTEPNILSKNVAVIDRKTQTMLYEKNAYQKVPMASTTKIITCLIALEQSNLNETVTVSEKAATIHGSTLGISKNSKILMIDLLYGLMLRSGNDCAIAIAEHISGSVEEFANLMNKKAKELNLINTNFVTPHGLDNDNHYTTAYELALLTNQALKNETFKKIISCKTCSISINNQSKTISNTNELLGNVSGVYGVKTGFTFKAGRCLVSSCNRNDFDIIVVVLGADTKKIRTSDSKKLIEYVYKNFSYVDTYPIVDNSFKNYIDYFQNNLVLEKTTDIPNIKISSREEYKFPLKQEDVFNLSTKIYTITKFSPEMKENEKIGVLTVFLNNKILYSLDITISNTLKPNSMKYYYTNILKNYFKSIFFI